jgi:uncharacterized protein (DUF4213/DUF364 family)
MWEIYNTLIAGIPDDLTADTIICGTTNTIVVNRLGAGTSSVLDGTTRHPMATGNLLGKSLREVAGLIKSWNFPEASIGHAALNSYYNSPTVLVGPCTTLAPYLLTCGVSDLSGFVIRDPERAVRLVSGSENGKVSHSGQKVSLKKGDAR